MKYYGTLRKENFDLFVGCRYFSMLTNFKERAL